MCARERGAGMIREAHEQCQFSMFERRHHMAIWLNQRLSSYSQSIRKMGRHDRDWEKRDLSFRVSSAVFIQRFPK